MSSVRHEANDVEARVRIAVQLACGEDSGSTSTDQEHGAPLCAGRPLAAACLQMLENDPARYAHGQQRPERERGVKKGDRDGHTPGVKLDGQGKAEQQERRHREQRSAQERANLAQPYVSPNEAIDAHAPNEHHLVRDDERQTRRRERRLVRGDIEVEAQGVCQHVCCQQASQIERHLCVPQRDAWRRARRPQFLTSHRLVHVAPMMVSTVGARCNPGKSTARAV